MFTGLTLGLQRVVSAEYTQKLNREGQVLRLSVSLGSYEASELAQNDVHPGASIAVNGVKLIVSDISKNLETKELHAIFDVVEELIRNTNLGSLKKGILVSIERSLRFGDEVGAPMMTGKIDCVARIEKKETLMGIVKIVLRLPAENDIGNNQQQLTQPPHQQTQNNNNKKRWSDYLLPNSCVSIDGKSVIVVDMDKDLFCISLMPGSLEHSTLGVKTEKANVNIEFDRSTKMIVETLKKIIPTLLPPLFNAHFNTVAYLQHQTIQQQQHHAAANSNINSTSNSSSSNTSSSTPTPPSVMNNMEFIQQLSAASAAAAQHGNMIEPTTRATTTSPTAADDVHHPAYAYINGTHDHSNSSKSNSNNSSHGSLTAAGAAAGSSSSLPHFMSQQLRTQHQLNSISTNSLSNGNLSCLINNAPNTNSNAKNNKNKNISDAGVILLLHIVSQYSENSKKWATVQERFINECENMYDKKIVSEWSVKRLTSFMSYQVKKMERRNTLTAGNLLHASNIMDKGRLLTNGDLHGSNGQRSRSERGLKRSRTCHSCVRLKKGCLGNNPNNPTYSNKRCEYYKMTLLQSQQQRQQQQQQQQQQQRQQQHLDHAHYHQP